MKEWSDSSQVESMEQRPQGVLQARREFLGDGTLRVSVCRVGLRLTSSGEMLPWVGTALRGIVASTLRRAECRFDVVEQNRRWRYCAGCPHLAHCGYAQLYEPELAGKSSLPQGAMQAPSGVVLSPCFPLPRRLRAGDLLTVDVTLTGAAATEERLAGLLVAMEKAGDDPGLGPHHIGFVVERNHPCEAVILSRGMFPGRIDDLPGGYRRVRIDLQSPHFFKLETAEKSRRLANRTPSMHDLFRHSLRLIRRLFAQSGTELEGDWTGLGELAAKVVTREMRFESFRQRRWSSRMEHRAELEGVVGTAWYADVPAVLIPWLYWGGQLHVGGQRVAGAGRFHVGLE